MGKIKILIVDDDINLANKIEKELKEIGYQVCGIACNYYDGFELFQNTNPDIILLDVHLNDELDGIDLAIKITNDFKKKIPIIFMTIDNTVNTFEKAKKLKPFSYLQKPADKFTIQHHIELALHFYSESEQAYSSKSLKQGVFTENHFFIKKSRKIMKVMINEILYAKVDSNYTTVFTKSDQYIIYSSLCDLHDKLPQNKFIRIHKNFIANLDEVSEFDFEEYTVSVSGKVLPLGKKYKPEIVKNIAILK